MKLKKILRFYFGADSLERAFDNLIKAKALNTESDALETADMLCSIIGEKIRLERLWAYIDGIILTFSDAERSVLLKYCVMTPYDYDVRRETKRVTIKFTRRAKRLKDFADDISILNKYYCLIKV